jgi:UDP-N-acetylmuramate: L-alanyl-gamma-D-glutamyl-meso-diaminopimelate ligase
MTCSIATTFCGWIISPSFLPTSKLEISDIGTTFNVEDNAVNWNLLGEHNMQNGVCAIYAAHHIGVEIKTACKAPSQ